MQYIINFDTINIEWALLFCCYFFFFIIIIYLDTSFMDYINEYEYEVSVDKIETPIKKIKYEDKYLKEYRDLLTTQPQITTSKLSDLKHNFVLEQTPLGNTIMYFNYNCDYPDTSSFIYYCDHSLPYNYLDTVARKYVITFNCLNLYIDIKKELKNAEEPEPIINPIKETKKPDYKSVFANLKNYNKTRITKSTNSSEIKPITNPKHKEVLINRYTSGGKLSNFTFLKKQDKRLVNKNYSLSFADFKQSQLKK